MEKSTIGEEEEEVDDGPPLRIMCSVVREYAPSSSRPREVDVFETTRVFFAVERRVPFIVMNDDAE
jgi:hypothetical protein